MENTCHKCAMENCLECTAVGCTLFKPASETCAGIGGVWLESGCVLCTGNCKTCDADFKCTSCNSDLVVKDGVCTTNNTWKTVTISSTVIAVVILCAFIGYVVYIRARDRKFRQR